MSILIYVLNRFFTVSFSDCILYQRWTGKKFLISYMRIFGCTAYLYISDEIRRKMDYKVFKQVFIGYIEGIKGYKFMDRLISRILYVRDVVFNEFFFFYYVTDD